MLKQIFTHNEIPNDKYSQFILELKNVQHQDEHFSDELMLSQFYKKDENAILFNLYRIVCENGQRELMYSDICKKYNEKYASSKKKSGG